MQPPNADCERSAELPAAANESSGTLVAIRALFTPRIWVRPPAQFVCYLVGAYLGFLAASSAETLLRSPSHSREEFEIPFALMAVLYVPTTVFLSLPYAAMQYVCEWYSKTFSRLPAVVPLLLGFAYFPALFTSIPCLIVLTGQGQGARIGTSIGCVALGYPIIAAAVAWRLGRVAEGQPCSPKRIDETSAGAGSVSARRNPRC